MVTAKNGVERLSFVLADDHAFGTLLTILSAQTTLGFPITTRNVNIEQLR